MKAKSKKNSNLIISKIEELQKEEWLARKKWWPKFNYHFTDITNAIKILECEALYSRNRAIKNELMQNDNASPDIISRTRSDYKDYVRLYFRPRTPTQFHNEGFIPKKDRKLGGAHCPVPIMFAFDSIPILTAYDTEFSDGNIASPNVIIDSSTKFYLSLDFEDIYHDSPISNFDSRKSSIIYHRQAEILIPDQLNLDNVKIIYCRSRAEFDTLRNLIPDRLWEKWSNKIGIDNRGLFFFRRWPFISEVKMDTKSVVFSSNRYNTGPFSIKFELVDHNSEITYTWKDDNYYFDDELEIDISDIVDLESYTVKLFIDDHIAYMNNTSDEDILV